MDDKANAKNTDPGSAPFRPIRPGQASILVADDEPAIRELLGTVLMGLGIGRIDNAQNGLEACELCSKNEYDMVFLDISMPVLSGIDACLKIREMRPEVRIIIITGLYQEEELMERLGKECMCAYIKKPFNIAEIQSIVSNLLHTGTT